MPEQRVSVITAASQGIGAACAEEMSRRGYRVVLMARSERIHEVARAMGGTACVGSVTNSRDLSELVAHTVDRYGQIDAVIANTGHPPKGNLLEVPDDDWHTALDMLLLSVIRLARLATPHMRSVGRGAFVNISTFGVNAPSLAYPVSSVVRAALTNFTALFARAHAKENIRMNNVLPGFVDNHPVSDDVLERIPAGRPAKPEEIANVAAFLASDESGYITGQDIAVDGGLLPIW